MYASVKAGTDRLSSTALLERGRNHVTMLTGNASYPTPSPTLAVLTTACDELDSSIQEVLFNGGKVAHERKRTRHRRVYELIKELAGYVQANCSGDRDKILSAGFDYRAGAKPVEKLEMPQNLRALLTNFEGQVPLKWDVVPDANNYMVFANSTNPEDEKAWELVVYTSRTSYTVEALESAKFYWFRVQAMGRKGLMSPKSEVIKALAA